jgi:DnaJ-class molecular chaperone
MTKKIVCPECLGDCREYVICQSCNGSGEGRADGAVCRDCHGDGEKLEVCPWCEGLGHIDGDRALEIAQSLHRQIARGAKPIHP